MIKRRMSIKRSTRPIRPRTICLMAAVGVVAIALLSLSTLRRYFWSPILNIKGGEAEFVYIPTGASYDDVVTILSADGRLTDPEALDVMSSLMGYKSRVKSGKYKLEASLSVRALVTKLRGGFQEPVRLTFNNVRSLEQLAGVAGRYLEADSAELIAAMKDSAILSELGFEPRTSVAMFLPDSYEIWWNTPPEAWVKKMCTEYHRFWSPVRLAKADSIGFSPLHVTTLASIVEEESNITEDQKVIAGLYINRLRIGMPMQACPTIKYALGDFAKRRVTYADTQVDSPYNTYKHQGLPPGPIRITSKSVIDAVLNYTPSEYLYMCARPDGSGRHDFARTLAGHQRNAANYHRSLNTKRIYR